MDDLYDNLDEQYDEEAEEILNEYGYGGEEESYDEWSVMDDFSIENDWLNDFLVDEEFKTPVYKGLKNNSSNIVQKESGGNYKAFNSAGGGEGAVGKYQFRWGLHKPKIRAFAGNPNLTAEQFMNSPELQDAFYEQYWIPNELAPSVNRLKRSGVAKGYSDDELSSLVHFRGEKGAIDYLTGKVGDKPEDYNMSISKYIGRQTGGISPQDWIKGIDKQAGNVFNGINKGVQMYQDVKENLGRTVSSGVEVGIGLLSQQQEALRNREMLERLYQDNPLQYGIANRNLNNIPIYTQEGGTIENKKFNFNWKK